MDNNSSYSFILGLVWGALGDQIVEEKKIKIIVDSVSDNLGIRLDPIEKEHIEKDCIKLMTQSVKNLTLS